MSENNKSYRIRTNVGSEYNGEIKLDVNLLQDYDEFEVLSLKIGTENLYKYHTANYGCIVGRVLANGGVGVPNVKISAFIPVEDIDTTDPVMSFLYPYSNTRDKNRDNIRYNLLTDTKIDDCHQNIGTFPNKRLVLDDNNVIEVYDKYYKFTTTTNGSGDYMLFGLPVGNNIIHSDLDLSDIGILSQKPRDMFYKGYTAKQFENASQFKKDTNLDNLTQVISQDSSVYVFPFWGDEKENEGQIKIVRNDIDVNYKFEPTCIFIGCIVSDEKSNAISKNCIPHERMGKMDRLTTGTGTIEMIRKTISGTIESYTIQGNELIDGNGTWCYQIPMNLDYMTTNEYGEFVPTDDYNKGIPTRTSVRFRVSLADYESDYENAHLVKVLVPNNPKVVGNSIDYDYEFGSATRDEAFRDMFWNNVYTVKSYIPRFQKGNRQKNKNFTGFKAVNVNGANNPIPYNNMRINFTFLFVFQCLIFKSLVLIVKTLNKIIYVLNKLNCSANACCGNNFKCGGEDGLVYLTLDGGMCPSLEGNYIAPGAETDGNRYGIVEHTYKNVYGELYDVKLDLKVNDSEVEYNDPADGKFKVPEGTALPNDPKSADGKNSDLEANEHGVITGKTYVVDDIAGEDQSAIETERMRIYNQDDYFVKCVELHFALEYEVIQFDFYNDWINGMLYIPRWFAEIRKNKNYAYYCGETFYANRYLTQQCAIGYASDTAVPMSAFPFGCRDGKQQCHKRFGRKNVKIFGKNKGVVVAQKNSREQYAYYLRPSELVTRKDEAKVKVNLFPTDIVLLGSVAECNQYGIPKVNGYTSSTYKMPPPTAEIISDSQTINFESSDNKKMAGLMAAASVLNTRISTNSNVVLSSTYTRRDDDLSSDEKGLSSDEKTQLRQCKAEDKAEDITKYSNVLCLYNKIRGQYKSVTIPRDILIESYEFSQYFSEDNTTPIYDVIKQMINIAHTKAKALEATIYDYNSSRSTGATMFSELEVQIGEQIIKDANNETKLRDNMIDAYNLLYSVSAITDTTRFFSFEKKTASDSQLAIDPSDLDEPVYSEIAGIDWGYNPFTTDAVEGDDTTLLHRQIAGHFLEIGCTFSMSNIKSCVNLQRVCELGGELSQSHYYRYKDGNFYKVALYDPTGIISKREISDEDIRTTFATLNSKNLGVIYDSLNGYKKYSFNPYAPVSFMGDLKNRREIGPLTSGGTQTQNYGLIESQSNSYRAFRFSTTNQYDILKKFLIKDDGLYFLPMYENSFYFYFGLRDGNTAIDRLYSEYYAQCDKKSEEHSVEFIVEQMQVNTYRLHYNTENMNMIKKLTVVHNGIPLKVTGDTLDSETAIWDKRKHTIDVYGDGIYVITLKDIDNFKAKSLVECYYNPTTADDPLIVNRDVKRIAYFDGLIDDSYKLFCSFDSKSDVVFSDNSVHITIEGVDFRISNETGEIYYKRITKYVEKSEISFSLVIKNYENTITFNCKRRSVNPYPRIVVQDSDGNEVQRLAANASKTYRLIWYCTVTNGLENKPTVSITVNGGSGSATINESTWSEYKVTVVINDSRVTRNAYQVSMSVNNLDTDAKVSITCVDKEGWHATNVYQTTQF